MKHNSIAIIPARGGSKRIPKKNIKTFFGKPIIEYSIKAAIESGCFSEVMVSTDDPRIAKIAKKAGASVPFIRSKTNSKDKTPIGHAVLEVLDEYEKLGHKFNSFCCLQATAPLIRVADIRRGMDTLLKSTNINSVFTVVGYGHPIQRSLIIKKGWLKMQWPKNRDKRSQDLEPTYHDAGQFYCVKTKSFRKEQHFFSLKSKGIILPEMLVQDIDIIDDWEVAEVKYKMLKYYNKIDKYNNKIIYAIVQWIKQHLYH